MQGSQRSTGPAALLGALPEAPSQQGQQAWRPVWWLHMWAAAAAGRGPEVVQQAAAGLSSSNRPVQTVCRAIKPAASHCPHRTACGRGLWQRVVRPTGTLSRLQAAQGMTHRPPGTRPPQAANQGCCQARRTAQQAMLHLWLQAVQAEGLQGLLQAVRAVLMAV
jgi:hypothetical protein